MTFKEKLMQEHHNSKDEVWKPIAGYEGIYDVSNLGRVRSLKGSKKILSTPPNSRGYYHACLYSLKNRSWFLVHRLVANAFVENVNEFQYVNHKNENKSNNCASNLEWCNMDYNNKYGTRARRSAESKKKKIAQLDKCGNIIKIWDSATDAERNGGFHKGHIIDVAKGRSKTHAGFKWRYES